LAKTEEPGGGAGSIPATTDEWLPLVYEDLRRIAARQLLGERREHTLQATAIVHEAYLRLCQGPEGRWPSRAHFFAFAARLMRRVLVDYARSRSRRKRFGGFRVTLAEVATPAAVDLDLLALDQALRRLEELDAQKVAIVELRFFGGLTLDEIAAELGLSPETVGRQWRRAKAWLYLALEGAEEGS